MTNRIRKAALASALAAMTLTSASPVMAQGYPYGDYGNGGYRHRDRGDSTGAAIVGGIVGIAIGALIAGGGNKERNRYRDRGWSYRDGYYWDRQGRRYDRNGQPCDEDRGGGDYYQGGSQDRDGYRDGYRDRDGYRGDYRGQGDNYYGRRGYRDNDGYRRGY